MNDLSDRALLSLQEARRYAWRDENDGSRDDILTDAVNYTSSGIWEHCEREFTPSTIVSRSGSDGVANSTMIFTSATASFAAADVAKALYIETRGYYRIVEVTNATTVVLDDFVSTGTGLTWKFGEVRTFELDSRGWIDLAPYDLRAAGQVFLYTDQPGSEQALAFNEYKPQPIRRALGGTYLSLRTIRPSISEIQPGFGWEATVDGFWGMDAIPETVKLACADWLKNLTANPGSFASSEMSGLVVTPDLDFATTGRGMPRSVQHRLQPFRRRP